MRLTHKRLKNIVGAAYLAAIVVCMFAISDQWWLKYRGFVYEGKGAGATKATGSLAQGYIAIKYGGVIICLTVAGILHLRMRYLLKNNAFSEDVPTYVICPKCLESSTCEKTPGMKCPNCNCTVEDLTGFYDRHPELKIKP